MKKFLLFFLIVIAFTVSANSQVVYESTIEYNKKKQAAFAIEYAYTPEAVENALANKMEQLGYKGKEEKGIFNKDKGFIVHKSAFITELYQSNMDYVFKVEPRGKKEKKESIVYMIVMKDGENAKAGFGATDIDKVKAFLTGLHPHVESAGLEIEIKGQEETVVKAEKKLKDLQDDQVSMEKKIKDLQEQLKQNATNQESQKKYIESQKMALDGLKGKRKA